MAGSFLLLVNGCAYFLGFSFLFYCGDASHMSLKTLHLMFVEFVLSVPPLFSHFKVDLMAVIIYVVGILVFTWNFSVLRPQRLDSSFRFHWLLILPAAAVPILMILSLENGLSGCTPETFGEVKIECFYTVLWATSYCLTPLMFLPQLLVWYKLSRKNTKLNSNVKLFLGCMMISAGAKLFLFCFFRYLLWEIGIVTSALTLFLIGLPFSWGLVCRYIFQKRSEEFNGVPTAGDVEMPSDSMPTTESSGEAPNTENQDSPFWTTIDPSSTLSGGSNGAAVKTKRKQWKSWFSSSKKQPNEQPEFVHPKITTDDLEPTSWLT